MKKQLRELLDKFSDGSSGWSDLRDVLLSTLFPAQTKSRILVCGYGGCAQTMLLEWLRKYRQTNCPHNGDGLKHVDHPPMFGNIDLALYLYCDPRDAIVSFFRRRKQQDNNWVSIHSMSIGGRMMPPEFGLSDWLFSGNGNHLPLTKHFYNWWESGVHSYPVVFVRYEQIWSCLEQLLGIVGLAHRKYDFPKHQPRQSKWESLPSTDAEELCSITEELRLFQSSLDPLTWRYPNDNKTAVV